MPTTKKHEIDNAAAEAVKAIASAASEATKVIASAAAGTATIDIFGYLVWG